MTSKNLYTEQDNEQLNTTIVNAVKNKENIIEEQGGVVLNSNSMFTDIKDIFTKEQTERKFTNYFTVSRGKVDFGIDNTILSPSSLVLLSSKRFEELYLKQLEDIIFTNQEEIDPDKLINLIFLIDFIKRDSYPIRIITGKYRKLAPKITNVLNNFVNKNYSILSSIHVMFTGSSNGVHRQPVEETLNDN